MARKYNTPANTDDKITKSTSISMNNESICIPEESRCRKPLNLGTFANSSNSVIQG